MGKTAPHKSIGPHQQGIIQKCPVLSEYVETILSPRPRRKIIKGQNKYKGKTDTDFNEDSSIKLCKIFNTNTDKNIFHIPIIHNSYKFAGSQRKSH